MKREPPPPPEPAAGGPAGFVIPKREPRDAVSHAPASGRGEAATRGGGALGRWACPACTFANADGDACALCDTPRPAAAVAADDDIEFVGEVPAPRAAAAAKASKATAVKRANGDASGANGRGSGGASAGGGAAAAPAPGARRQVARRRGGRAAEAEAEDLSVSGSGSEYGGESEDDDDDEDGVDLEEERRRRRRRREEEEKIAVPRRARAPRAGSRGAAARAAPAISRRRPAAPPPPDPPPGGEEEIVFDGGLRLPAETYDRLLEHQKTSLKWLWELHCQRAGGIVGDEMGLGKTVQVAAFLCALERSGLYQPSLVVCPATMLRQWRRELRIWAPRLGATLILHESAVSAAALAAAGGDKKLARRKMLRDCVNDPKGVLLTTYEHVRATRDALLSVRWGYAVLDEGHKIRNPDADITICAKQLQTVHRIIMTGAPIQNRLSELWSLFDFCFPGKLGTLPVFQAEFAVPIQVGGYANASQQQVVTAFRCATTLKDLISPFLLRRMKVDVDIRLPTKTEQVLFCPMTADQREAYRAFVHSRDVEEILEGRREALSGIDVLRKIVNHPDLLERQTKATHADYGNAERSGKQMVTMKVLGLWREQKHRALLFSQTQQMLDILEAAVANAGYVYRRMDGTTPVKHRMRLIDEFNTDTDVFVFLLTTKVGARRKPHRRRPRVAVRPGLEPLHGRAGARTGVAHRAKTGGDGVPPRDRGHDRGEGVPPADLQGVPHLEGAERPEAAALLQGEGPRRPVRLGGGYRRRRARRRRGRRATRTRHRNRRAVRGGGGRDQGGRLRERGERRTRRGRREPGQREDGDDDEDAWDPSSTPGGSGGAGRRGDATRGARRKTPGGFRAADVPGSAPEAARDPTGEGDAAIMRSLFGGGGTIRGGGVIRGAMNHDAIVNASGGATTWWAGAPPPRRTAARAASARRCDPVGPSAARVQRRRAHLDREIRRRGRAAARTGQQQRRRAVRPPWSARRRRRARPASPASPARRGTAVARRPCFSAFAPATRRRRRAVPTSSSPAPRPRSRRRHCFGTWWRSCARAPLRARPPGLVVDAFQDRVGPTQHALFRRLLKVAATLEKNPPNAAGAGGGAAWVLKDEFR